MTREKYSINSITPIKKAVCLIMIGVFLCTDTLTWAASSPSAQTDTFAPPLRLTQEEFRDKYLAYSTLLSHEAANKFIGNYISSKQKIEGDITSLTQYSSDKVDVKVGAITEEQEIHIVGVEGLLKNTGQLAHVGLGRRNGIPVIYVDSKYFYNEDVISHEKDEIAKWEGKRRELGLTYSGMRNWIKNPETSPEAKRIAAEFNKSSHNIGHIYAEIKRDYKNFVDLDNIYKIYLVYGMDEEDRDVNIAAKKDDRTNDKDAEEVATIIIKYYLQTGNFPESADIDIWRTYIASLLQGPIDYIAMLLGKDNITCRALLKEALNKKEFLQGCIKITDRKYAERKSQLSRVIDPLIADILHRYTNIEFQKEPNDTIAEQEDEIEKCGRSFAENVYNELPRNALTFKVSDFTDEDYDAAMRLIMERTETAITTLLDEQITSESLKVEEEQRIAIAQAVARALKYNFPNFKYDVDLSADQLADILNKKNVSISLTRFVEALYYYRIKASFGDVNARQVDLAQRIYEQEKQEKGDLLDEESIKKMLQLLSTPVMEISGNKQLQLDTYNAINRLAHAANPGLIERLTTLFRGMVEEREEISVRWYTLASQGAKQDVMNKVDKQLKLCCALVENLGHLLAQTRDVHALHAVAEFAGSSLTTDWDTKLFKVLSKNPHPVVTKLFIRMVNHLSPFVYPKAIKEIRKRKVVAAIPTLRRKLKQVEDANRGGSIGRIVIESGALAEEVRLIQDTIDELIEVSKGKKPLWSIEYAEIEEVVRIAYSVIMKDREVPSNEKQQILLHLTTFFQKVYADDRNYLVYNVLRFLDEATNASTDEIILALDFILDIYLVRYEKWQSTFHQSEHSLPENLLSIVSTVSRTTSSQIEFTDKLNYTKDLIILLLKKYGIFYKDGGQGFPETYDEAVVKVLIEVRSNEEYAQIVKEVELYPYEYMLYVVPVVLELHHMGSLDIPLDEALSQATARYCQFYRNNENIRIRDVFYKKSQNGVYVNKPRIFREITLEVFKKAAGSPDYGPALFIDQKTGEVRELIKDEHEVLNPALSGLVFGPVLIKPLGEEEIRRLIGQELYSSIQKTGPPISIYVIDNDKLIQALPERYHYLAQGLITHAGTWRKDPSGQKHANLFIARSIYETLLSLPEDSKELRFWRDHEVGHLMKRDALVKLDDNEKALAKRIWMARKKRQREEAPGQERIPSKVEIESVRQVLPAETRAAARAAKFVLTRFKDRWQEALSMMGHHLLNPERWPFIDLALDAGLPISAIADLLHYEALDGRITIESFPEQFQTLILRNSKSRRGLNRLVIDQLWCLYSSIRQIKNEASVLVELREEVIRQKPALIKILNDLKSRSPTPSDSQLIQLILNERIKQNKKNYLHYGLKRLANRDKILHNFPAKNVYDAPFKAPELQFSIANPIKDREPGVLNIWLTDKKVLKMLGVAKPLLVSSATFWLEENGTITYLESIQAWLRVSDRMPHSVQGRLRALLPIENFTKRAFDEYVAQQDVQQIIMPSGSLLFKETLEPLHRNTIERLNALAKDSRLVFDEHNQAWLWVRELKYSNKTSASASISPISPSISKRIAESLKELNAAIQKRHIDATRTAGLSKSEANEQGRQAKAAAKSHLEIKSKLLKSVIAGSFKDEKYIKRSKGEDIEFQHQHHATYPILFSPLSKDVSPAMREAIASVKVTIIDYFDCDDGSIGPPVVDNCTNPEKVISLIGQGSEIDDRTAVALLQTLLDMFRRFEIARHPEASDRYYRYQDIGKFFLGGLLQIAQGENKQVKEIIVNLMTKNFEKIDFIRQLRQSFEFGDPGKKETGSPAGFLETIKSDPELLRKARSKKGFTIPEVMPHRLRDGTGAVEENTAILTPYYNTPSTAEPTSTTGAMARDYLPRIAPEYAQWFVQEFVRALDKVDFSEPPKKYLEKIIEKFDEIRKSHPELKDEWLQPYLMLEKRDAILIFKKGRNTIHFGSPPIAYRIPLDRGEIKILKALKGDVLLKETYIPYKEYLERYNIEENVAIAGRSMDHSTYLNFIGIIDKTSANVESLISDLTGGPYRETLSEDIRELLKLTSHVIDTCINIAHTFTRIAGYHKFHKILFLEEMGFKKDKLVKALDGLLFIEEQWNKKSETFDIITKGDADLRKDIDRLKDNLLTAIAVLQAEIDLIEERSTDSIETKNGVEILENLLVGIMGMGRTTQQKGVTIAKGEFSLEMTNNVGIYLGNVKVQIDNLDKLRKYLISGNWRSLAFSIENAIYGALRASENAGKPVEIFVSIIRKNDKEYIEAIIRDYGKGIPKDELFKISDPDYSTKARETGWAFARRAIEYNEGEVEIDSRTADDAEYGGKRKKVGTDVIIRWRVRGINKARYSRSIVYKEVEALKDLGIIVPVEAKPGYYRFSDMMIGPDSNYTKTLINVINDIKYQIGKRGEERPLHRGDIPEEKRPLAKELVKMAILHQINLMQHPAIPEGKVLWHILERDIVSVSQQSSFAQEINNAAERSKAPERIYILKKGESIEEAISRLSMAHPDAIFDIALSEESHIENVPGDIKRLVFKGSAGDVAQLEGVVAALRALHGPKEDIIPTLKRIYALLKGTACQYEIPPDVLDDPVKLARTFIFDLPPATPIPADEIRKMNDRLLQLLIAA